MVHKVKILNYDSGITQNKYFYNHSGMLQHSTLNNCLVFSCEVWCPSFGIFLEIYLVYHFARKHLIV